MRNEGRFQSVMIIVMHSPMTKYEAVREEIVEACPELEDGGYVERTARLSHVLRAIKAGGEPSVEFPSLTMTLNGRFKNTTCHLLDRWDLTKDDLSLQSPETIDFLFNILCE